ncbi:MAG: type II toxin-antitoxin system RelE/ParE family toxin [Rhizobacter sp.]|nr:type II toxin-antitoxin system RelE/ParE family toxin [Rhizobacter sp.]
MSYFLSPEAEEELAEAVAFYAEQASTSVATAFLAEFTRAAHPTEANPGLGTRTSRDRRLFPLHRFPYSLVYRADNDGVRIGAVAHHSRPPRYWRTRK